MIIYDETALVKETVTWLSAVAGYEVRIVSDLSQGLSTIREFRPDVVLIQYHWPPNKNALELLNLIKVKTPQTPTIVFDVSLPNQTAQGELTRKVRRFLAKDFLFDSLGPKFESALLRLINDVLRERTAVQIAEENGVR